MTDTSAIKDAARKAIDAVSPALFDISNRMHAEVELAFEEVKAQAWQCKVLRDAGFTVEEGLGSLKTAFRATVASGKPGPRIAFHASCTPGYYNHEGQVDEALARHEYYVGGPMAYDQMLADWRAEGSMKGLDLTKG